MSLCWGRPRSKAFISLHAWQKQFISCNFASMGKKRGINLSMLFMEIYGSLGNANVINIYLQRVSKWPSCPRFAFKIKLCGEKKIGGDTESALHCKSTQCWFLFFFLFLRVLCHISGEFLPPPPSVPSFLSKYLSLCASVPRWRRGKPSGAFVLPECLSWKYELFQGLAERRFI